MGRGHRGDAYATVAMGGRAMGIMVRVLVID